MRKFDFYGLFLTQDVRDKLVDFIENLHPDDPVKKMIDKGNGYIINHCILLHKSKFTDDNKKIREELDKIVRNPEKRHVVLIVDGIGYSDKAVAFSCRIFGSNKDFNNLHITICTIGDGKPVDSNEITNWRDINPIRIRTIIYKHYLD